MVEYHQMLTTSLPPVTLISGVGLLLLAMTARYNHSTNRVRQLLRERNSIAPRENQDLNHEIDLIFERASLLRMSILTVVLSATFSGLHAESRCFKTRGTYFVYRLPACFNHLFRQRSFTFNQSYWA